MCDRCKRKMPAYLETTIVSESETSMFCPNCLALLVADNKLNIKNGIYKSEISGKDGAVKIITIERNGEVNYFLTPDEAFNLFNHGLTPKQYNTLVSKHDPNEYLLHDDFYYESKAYQPIDEDYYERECRKELNEEYEL